MSTSPDAIVSPELTTTGRDPVQWEAGELKALLARRDAPAWRQLAAHLTLLAIGGVLWLTYWFPLPGMQPTPLWAALPALVLYGLSFATMFAAMHECVHRTAFKTNAFNDSVGWFAGLLSFYNSTFYRHYHGWHHRFTQLSGKDPELEDRKPTTWLGYVVEISGVTWWYGKLRGHTRLALGRITHLPYVPEDARAEVVRSIRMQLAVYAALIALSAVTGSWWFVLGWLLPLAVGQPFLRMFLLAEHGGCSNDGDRYANTRTTKTNALVRVLMWQMPYHAEHHRFPALPFFQLAVVHEKLKPHLRHLAAHGYLRVQPELLRRPGLSAPTPAT